MVQRIEADRLIPGIGAPVEDAVVVMNGGVIDYAGPAADAPSTPDATPVRVNTVMPGLWESHGHFMGLRSPDLDVMPQETIALRSARVVRCFRDALDAGVTSVREVGGLGIYLVPGLEEGSLIGPSVYSAGIALSVTGGHADLHTYPLHWIEDFGHLGAELRMADGPAECAKAAREQLRKGARLIKVAVSGGVLSEMDSPEHQQFTRAELGAIIEVAGMAERIVAAHCHGKAGMMTALEMGVKTIEHGTFLDEEAAQAMKETGAILVPTRSVFIELQNNGHLLPDYVLRKLKATIDRHAEAVTIAMEAGVTIAAGTDIALTGREMVNSWGNNANEAVLLAELGMTPLQAIEAATATGPNTLGPQAPKSGQLVAGYDADVIVLDTNPLDDIGMLARPEHITGVWKAGNRVK
jgi:imidazolonepropionase-like amidohydrolase